MTSHRVKELSLRLRVPAGMEQRLRNSAERFTRAVLERCADAMEAHWPGRVVLVRRLPIRWGLSEAALADESAVTRCTDDLFRALAIAARDALAPSTDDDIAVFEDEAHWLACRLSAQVSGNGGWLAAALAAEGDAADALCAAESRELTAAVLARLAAEDALVRVLTALPATKVVALWRVLSAPTSTGSSGRLVEREAPPQREQVVSSAFSTRMTEQLAAFVRSLPGFASRDAILLAAHGQAHLLLGPGASETDIRFVVAQALEAAGSGPAASAAILAAAAQVDVSSIAAVTGPVAARDSDSVGPAECDTRFGGLFYLLTCALELDLGEALWNVCLPEGGILAASAAALLGRAGSEDPAPALLGGVSEVRIPEVSAAQQEEVSCALVAALATALPRRGLAALPEVIISTATNPAGRLLVVTPVDSPFVLFARPLLSARDLTGALGAFLDVWPPAAPRVLADAELMAAAAEFRLSPSRAAPTDPFLPSIDPPSVVALLAGIAGTLCHLLQARMGAGACGAAADFVSQFLMLPARILVTDESLTVSIPLAHLDLRVRRAGLDRDPGWVPWLQQTVRIVFEDTGWQE